VILFVMGALGCLAGAFPTTGGERSPSSEPPYQR
jgi:hypothetical protein